MINNTLTLIGDYNHESQQQQWQADRFLPLAKNLASETSAVCAIAADFPKRRYIE